MFIVLKTISKKISYKMAYRLNYSRTNGFKRYFVAEFLGFYVILNSVSGLLAAVIRVML